MKVVLFVSLLATAVLASPDHEEHHAHPKYSYKYGVKDAHTHDIKQQHETRDGDKVSGYYKLVQPDGTTRTVHYSSDKHSGFNAHVEKSGHSSHVSHPGHSSHVAHPHVSYNLGHGGYASFS
ncbi:Cuticle protein 19 [Blattella germanica]|nr:Cuticle protein 19 [Blattella germanica]